MAFSSRPFKVPPFLVCAKKIYRRHLEKNLRRDGFQLLFGELSVP
jgi:hypothetical protein